MTAQLMSRERLEEIVSDQMINQGSEFAMLARMALAAMDSEPVGEFYEDGPLNWYQISDGDRVPEHRRIPLYRHAQQPVVPEEKPIPNTLSMYAVDAVAAIAEVKGWNACRAAMLQAQSDDDGEPTDDERIMAIEGIHNCERCGDEGWVVGEMGITSCACGQGNPVFKIDHNSDFIKHVKAVSEKVRAGNSPVIPDGYVMVPKDLLSELRDWAHPEIEKYCEMWEGRRDSEFPALRIVIADADALLAAAPHDTPALNSLQSVDSVVGRWVPVSERMPEGSEEVLCAKEFDGPGDWRRKVGYLLAGKWTVYGASWTPTHWMPLPAAPQEVNHG